MREIMDYIQKPYDDFITLRSYASRDISYRFIGGSQ